MYLVNHKIILTVVAFTVLMIMVQVKPWKIIHDELQIEPLNITGETSLDQNSHPLLEDLYRNYQGSRLFHHWEEYAQHYDDHLIQLFERMPNKTHFRMLEIGVQSGGSVEIWKSYFTKRDFYYVGMDINPNCKRSENVSQNIFIEIGDQADPQKLLQICERHGPFDFIVDDGGHMYDQFKTSLDTLFPTDACMTQQSLYVIEDLHVMAFGKTYSTDSRDVSNFPGYIFRKMHFYWFRKQRNELDANDQKWADLIKSISLYDSMMFITRGVASGPLTEIKKGDDKI